MHTNSLHRFLLATIAMASVVLLGSPAQATPGFPDEIQGWLKSNGFANAPVPDCSVCHVGSQTRGTVTTTFGAYLMQRGLVANNTASLDNALAAAKGESHDSNGNGVSDIDELGAGKDPNAGGAAQPEFGCVGQIAPRARGAGWTLSLGFVAAIALLARRRKAI